MLSIAELEKLVQKLDPVELDAQAKRWIKQFYETGDERYFEYLVRSYDGNLCNWLKYREPTYFVDVASNTWVKCYKQLKDKRFDETRGASFKTYLFTSANWEVKSFWKSKYGKESYKEGEDIETALGGLASQYGEPEKETILEEIKMLFQLCVDKLPVEQQEVFILRMDNLFSEKVVANLTQAPEGTVKTRRDTAKSKMIDCLKPHFPDLFADNN